MVIRIVLPFMNKPCSFYSIFFVLCYLRINILMFWFPNIRQNRTPVKRFDFRMPITIYDHPALFESRPHRPLQFGQAYQIIMQGLDPVGLSLGQCHFGIQHVQIGGLSVLIAGLSYI